MMHLLSHIPISRHDVGLTIGDVISTFIVVAFIGLCVLLFAKMGNDRRAREKAKATDSQHQRKA